MSWLLLALLVILPLPLGANRLWAILPIAGVIFNLCAVWFLRQINSTSQIRIRRTGLDIPFLLYFLIALASLLFGFSVSESGIGLLRLLALIIFYFLATNHLQTKTDWLGFNFTIIGIGALLSLIGLLQYVGGMNRLWWDNPNFLSATYVNHNHFAGLLELAIPLAIGFLFSDLDVQKKFFLAVVSAVMLFAFILSLSRGAWLSLGLAFLFGFFLFQRKKMLRNFLIMAFLISIAFIFSLLIKGLLFARIDSMFQIGEDLSFKSRLLIWQGTVKLISGHLFFGNGLGAFRYFFPRYQAVGLNKTIDFAHNDYLQTAADTGLMGLAIFIIAGLIVLKHAYRIFRTSNSPWKRSVAWGGFVGILSLGLHSLVDFNLQIPANAFFTVTVAALVMSLERHKDKENGRYFIFRLEKRPVLRSFRFFILIGLVLVNYLLLAKTLAHLFSLSGNNWEKKDALVKAERNFTKAVFLDRLNPAYHCALGRLNFSLFKQNRVNRELLEKARENYARAISLNPYAGNFYYELSLVEELSGKTDTAQKLMYKALSLHPNNPLFMKHLADIFYREELFPEAASLYRRLGQMSREFNFFVEDLGVLDLPQTYIARGDRELVLGRITSSLKAYRMAGVLEPDSREAGIGEAVCLIRLGKTQEAKEIFVSLNEIPEQNSRFLFALAQLSLQKKDYPAAEKYLKEALGIASEDIEILQQLMALSEKNPGMQIKRKELLERILKLNGPYIKTEFKNGQYYLTWEPELGNYALGRATYGGWSINSNGFITQKIFLPPVRVKMTIVAAGENARGISPQMLVKLGERIILETEVPRNIWQRYVLSTPVKVGDDEISIGFTNDYVDKFTDEDRNLKLDKVVFEFPEN